MISYLKLVNWLSHKHTEIRFNAGKNLIIGNNGSGKTSIVEGIFFALFGDVKGSYRGDIDRANLIHHGESHAEVQLKFQDYLIIRKLIRTKKGSKSEASIFKKGKLVAEGSDRVSQIVLDILDMDKDVFSNILYGGQEMLGAFLKQSPKEQKEMLDRAFNIHKLKKYLEQTKKLLSEVDRQLTTPVDIKQLQELQNKLNTLRKEIQETSEEMSKLSKDKENLKLIYDKTLVSLKRIRSLKEEWERLTSQQEYIQGQLKSYQDVRDVNHQLLQLYEEVQQIKQQISKQEHLLENYRNKIQQYNVLITRLNDYKKKQQILSEKLSRLEIPKLQKPEDLAHYEKELGALEQQYNELIKQLNHVKLGKGANTCPVCGRPLTDEHVKNLEKQLLDQLKHIKSKYYNLLDIYKKKLKQKEEYEKLLLKQNQLLAKKQAWESEINEINTEISKLVKIIKQMDVSDLEKEYNVRESQLKVLRDKYTTLEVNLKQLQEQQKRWEKKQYLEHLLKEVQQKLQDVSYSPQQYEEVLERYHKIAARLESLERELRTLQKTKQTTKALYDEVYKQFTQLMETYEKQRTLTLLKQELTTIKDTLEYGQIEARKEIVMLINEYLPEFWENLSPSRYYQNPHLSYEHINKVVGHGYKFYVESPKGKLEAQMLSGGEKTIYMLALKLTLVKLLSKHSLLIWDEPTQFLDEYAVKLLSESINQLTEEELGQLIVITHDDTLKEADWDTVIQVSKKGQGNYKYSYVELF